MGQRPLIGAIGWNHQEMLTTLHCEGEAKHLSVPFKPQDKLSLPLPSTEQYGAATLTKPQMFILYKC